MFLLVCNVVVLVTCYTAKWIHWQKGNCCLLCWGFPFEKPLLDVRCSDSYTDLGGYYNGYSQLGAHFGLAAKGATRAGNTMRLYNLTRSGPREAMVRLPKQLFEHL